MVVWAHAVTAAAVGGRARAHLFTSGASLEVRLIAWLVLYRRVVVGVGVGCGLEGVGGGVRMRFDYR